MKLNRALTNRLSVPFLGVSQGERAGGILFDGNRYHPCDAHL